MICINQLWSTNWCTYQTTLVQNSNKYFTRYAWVFVTFICFPSFIHGIHVFFRNSKLNCLYQSKVHIFWEGHKIFTKSPPYFCPMQCQSKVRWRFCKILWPSQNIWTLTEIQSVLFNLVTLAESKKRIFSNFFWFPVPVHSIRM